MLNINLKTIPLVKSFTTTEGETFKVDEVEPSGDRLLLMNLTHMIGCDVPKSDWVTVSYLELQHREKKND